MFSAARLSPGALVDQVIDRPAHVLVFLSTLRDLHPAMAHWGLNGGCFRVHLLLRQAFPGAEPWYDGCHVITRIDDVFFDIRGQVQAQSHIPMDPLCFNRAYQWGSKAEAPEASRPRLRIVWQCEQHDAGWLVIAKAGDCALARQITKAEWREAHDQRWLFLSVIQTLTRNSERLEVGHV